MGGPVCDPHEDRRNADKTPGVRSVHASAARDQSKGHQWNGYCEKESSAGRTFPGNYQGNPSGHEDQCDPDDFRRKDGAEISGYEDRDR